MTILNYKGMIFFMKNRNCIGKRKSGGIVVGFKSSLKRFIAPVGNNCELISWFQISHELIGIDGDVAFGTVHIPPGNTRYANNSAFDKLEL